MNKRQSTLTLKIATGSLLLIAMSAVALFPNRILTLQSTLATQGWEAMLIFVIAYVILVVLLMPMTALNIIGGLFFGPTTGLILNLFAGSIGAQCAFLVSRTLGANTLHTFLDERMKRAKRLLHTTKFEDVLLLRLMPVLPYNILNYAFGVTKVSAKDHFFATLIGIIPAVALYTITAGIFGKTLLEEGFSGLDPTQKFTLVLALVLLATLALMPLLIKRKRETL